MIVSCPNCETRFTLPDGAIGASGRKMKCAKCGHKWHQMPEDNEAEAASAPMEEAAAGDVPAGAAPEPATAGGGADVPLEMDPGTPAPRPATEPDGGDIPMESGPGGRRPEADDDTTDLSAIAAMLDNNDLGGDDDLDDEAERQDLGRLLDADEPDPIPSMFGSPDDEDDKPKRRWPVVLVLLLVVVGGLGAGAWYGRQQVVAWVPQTAPLYAALGAPVQTLGMGLRFQNVAGERVVEDGVDTLIVRGFIANVAGGERPVPHLRLTLYDAEDNPVQSMVSRPPQETVASESTAGFRLTLENPPATARRFEVDWTDAPESGAAPKAQEPASANAQG
ncbi:DUF3426 domain-containing protein [Caenispirillum salinarum]|nr:DUF3426 domain-containing protein [Caenispirillum salinarum]